MTRAWTPEELDRLEAAEELEVATRRADGTLRRWTPIWVVRAGDGAFVRTWRRRDTGWYGHAVRDGRLRVRVAGLETDVEVNPVGAREAGRRSAVDAAYATKYGRYGAVTVDNMTSDDAAAATLQLVPA